MKKSDVIKQHPALKVPLEAIQRGKIYRVVGHPQLQKCIFQVTHFYKGGVRAKALTNPPSDRKIWLALKTIPETSNNKWTFSWLMFERGLKLIEVPHEDLPTYINDDPTPYYKVAMGHDETVPGDYNGKKNDPARILRLKRAKFRKRINQQRMKLLGI